MKEIKYLSPTSINVFLKNPEDFYLQYLADIRQRRAPQTQPMSIGSAFDAYVKSFLHTHIFGRGKDPKFEFNTLFEAQVEQHNRTWAKEHGERVFNAYLQSGSLGDLLHELEGSTTQPRFEVEVHGVVNGYREGVTRDIGVPLLGKPDIHFIHRNGASLILDWKVNGYCSAYPISPLKGYVKCREVGAYTYKQHKEALVILHKGIYINAAHYLEDLNRDWALQLGIYGWLCGEEIGSEFITAIDQVACSPPGPKLRFAQHRTRISNNYQWHIFKTIQDIWERATSGHFFPEMSREESQSRCQLLEDQARQSYNSDDMFNQICQD